MSTITFDTLKFAGRLEQAGATRELAAAMAEAQREAFAEVMDATLASKGDIVRLESRIDTAELRMVAELVLVKWMLGVVVAIAIANFAKQFF